MTRKDSSGRIAPLILQPGEKYGLLTVVREVGRHKGSRVYECMCDCGGTKDVISHRLKSLHTHSCGCLRKHRTEASKQRSVMNYVACVYPKGAEARGFPFELTRERTVELLCGSCVYCGVSPQPYTKKLWRVGDSATVYKNGIDRVDNTKGYVEGNVVSCCYQCNIAKRDMTMDEWRSYVDRIAKEYMKRRW